MVVSIQQKERVKKTALFFAGLGHLQPLLLAATNSDYLLDRFLLERRCSSEYISRTITSLIFVEILATILMGGFAVLLGLYPDFFSKISREKEEDFRSYLTVGIQWIIFMGYLQILKAFTSGGEEGHIQWFYFSLLFQHFFTCIIGAGIGFIDVDRALWYLMNIPMSPVLIFFYQMLIHMWARKNGLACPAYLVVKNQIWLGLINSFLATLLWIIAYFPGLYNSQPIPDVVEVRIELDKTDGYYDCTISGLNRVCMLVSGCKDSTGYNKYIHLPDTSGYFKGKKFTVTSICQGGSSIKKVSFPEAEFCTHAEVYQSKESGKRCLLVKLVMEDGSAYYYCPRKDSNGWCVGKLPTDKPLDIPCRSKGLPPHVNDCCISASSNLQYHLREYTGSNSGLLDCPTKTSTTENTLQLNLENAYNYICTSGGTDILITVTKGPEVGGFTCYTHSPSSKNLSLDKEAQNGRKITLENPPKNVDHAHVYWNGSQPILLVVVTTNGEKWYCGKSKPGCQGSPQTWVGGKLNEKRYLSPENLKDLLEQACQGFGQNELKNNLNKPGPTTGGSGYSTKVPGYCNDTSVSNSSKKHTVCLDLGNTCEYWSECKDPYKCGESRSDGNNKTLISVDFTDKSSDVPNSYCKFVHKLDSGYKFPLDSLTIDKSYLTLHPSIDGLVDEISTYYQSGGNMKRPLMICVKSKEAYCYYCKGSDNCWYRYKNGSTYNEITPTGDANTGLGKLLEKLKGDPSKALTKDNFPNLSGDLKTRLQSDHPNYDYWKVLGNHDGGSPWNPLCWRLSGTFMPLAMHGLAVGAMGSIYPHLVPKTLVSAKHARIFDILSMFLAPLPHFLNLLLAETKSKAFANRPWEGGDKWYLAWLFYVPYLLSFLLIIFNIHYPRWRTCCYIRSHTWLAFLIMLSVSFTNEILLATARGGIMDQRSGNRRLGGDGKGLKNDHSLYNKMAPFMALSYIPFWLTTSPMIKSYAHAVCQLSDRDSWPTSCCGFWSSFGYWCKCGCHGLYTSLPKLLTFNMRTALTHKDDRLFVLVTSDLPKEEWFTDW